MGLNLAHFLDVSASQYGEKTAIILDDFHMSYAELGAAARKVANILTDRGIGRGDKVAVMVPNVPHFPILYYGILHTGAVVVPLNCLLTSPEIQYHLEDSEARLLFAWKGLSDEFVKAFREVETCHTLILVDTPDDPATGADYASLTALAANASAEFDTVQTMPDDTAVILYTSGTTGRPKGAELTQFNMFFNALCVRDHIIKLTEDDMCLVILPLYHSFAQTCLQNAPLLAGATLTMVPAFEPQKVVNVIKRDKVTFVALVPSIYFLLVNMKRLEPSELGSVRLCVSGGDALPAALLAEFEERFGKRIIEGYGLTETSPVASFNLLDRPSKPGSIGLPIWGCEMRVIREDGAFAEVEEVGEIVIRGHNIMKGYYKKPAATEEAIVNGWFHSGDLGKVDDEGYFHVVDRKKDLIIRNGMNIYPREVEDVLHNHPAVLEAAVIGIPDPKRGEEVKAYVSLKEGASITVKELVAYCRERLAPYKYPRHIEIRPDLPKGATGKVLKRGLRAADPP